MVSSLLYLFMLTSQSDASLMSSGHTYARFEQMPGEVMEVTFYYEDGSVRQTGFVENNLMSGEWITYSEHGTVTARAYYEEGKKTGKWKVYDEEGELVYKICYKNDVKLWCIHSGGDVNGSDLAEK